ncbi:Josephin-domain-containing protein [Gloeopeniophorella convolvens]|nr:Josephin-domain-containing protein [Gloeopeniophorella convolvens]
MAGLEVLVTYIYHEKQEPGSMLCAQHALNSLLQGSYFTPPDLSSIAQSLDSLEQDVDQGRVGRASANMDDTGFFSVQVLENALNVWGQSLVRWRSEIMQPHHDRPQDQHAFILNYEHHWFTLRRFGAAEGAGHWFNLNSFLDQPEWVSKTYLGMVLQQAEAEGYSVFVVLPTDPDHPLPQSEADVVATTLPEPTSSSLQHLSTARTPRAPPGLENEDFELQAALQASLRGDAGQDQGAHVKVPSWATAASGSSSSSAAMPLTSRSPPLIPPPSTRPADQPMADPVAASMARNRAMLEQMRQEQEAALREQYLDEAARFDPIAGPHTRDDDEDEQLRRAIAESETLIHRQGHVDADEDISRPATDHEAASADEWSHEPALGDRVYDDEDAELQAALRASLETVPPGFRLPDTPPRAFPQPPAPPTASAAQLPHASSAATREDDDGELDYEDNDVDTSVAETESDAHTPVPEEDLSVEEMRRRRLARFGGT